ncbi:hypothetical protein B0J18DRAFT_2007 [Chaetomium sp. MPI-SDFR-AT-0129]|nr:hypothetical protein B0J18DRAFT_2007 [Chaetomium sp. MPI-SDFR-AT-0129]
MFLRWCSIENCDHPAERYVGSCMICAKHMCADHVGGHTCPSSTDGEPAAYYAAYATSKRNHLAALLGKINVKALEAAASTARNGTPCSIPSLGTDISSEAQVDFIMARCGGQNCHLEIEFNDGVIWLARIRLDDPLLPPPEVQARIFLSEVATLQFLADTKVPAPRVYAYELSSSDNAVGVPYIFMEKLSGKPLDWNDATEQQRVRVMEQLTDLYLELERHPLPLTSSLVPSPNPATTDKGSTQLGPFAQAPCFATPDRALGPFDTLTEGYTALVRQQQHMLANREVSGLPVDNYLAFLWRLEALPELVAESASRSGPFYLKHYDDKGDHILVDDEYNITGVIDWEFASAEAKELAFSSPCMMWPVGEFYDGSIVLSDEETKFAATFERRGRADMAALVRGGRKWQRYLFFMGGGIPRDMVDFEPLFQGLRKSFLGKEDGANIPSYLEWKQSALAGFAKGDKLLQDLMRAERASARKTEAA